MTISDWSSCCSQLSPLSSAPDKVVIPARQSVPGYFFIKAPSVPTAYVLGGRLGSVSGTKVLTNALSADDSGVVA